MEPQTLPILDRLAADLAPAAKAVRRFGDALLFHGDCMNALAEIRGRIDAVVADPPYGINYVPGSGGGIFAGVGIVGDDRPFDPAPFLRLAPVTCLWGANHFASRLPDSSAWLAWDKRGGREPMHQADCELAWTNGRRPARLLSHFWSGANRGSERGEHWHPTQKSTAVMIWCLDQLQLPRGAIVFDPFMGSGTTALACLKTRRWFVGFEIEERWFEAACARLERFLAQPSLL